MHKTRTSRLALAIVLATAVVSQAQEPSVPATKPADDPRQLVSMPAAAQRLLRQDMLQHMAALNQLFGLLAASEYAKASELAERSLGMSSRGRHRGTGMGPGRFMPPEMHRIGIAMHQAASDFAVVVEKGEASSAYTGLQRVTSACVACHAGFRVR